MMNNLSSEPNAESARYAGPHLGAAAVVYVALKIASVIPVSAFGIPFGVRPPFFPGLNAPVDRVAVYFGTHPSQVLVCAFLQFGTAIPLGIFTAAVVSRLRFLGINVAGIYIAFLGGLMAAVDEAISGAILWVMAHPVIAKVPVLTQTFHYLAVALGGPGFTMPQGLLMAGISIPALHWKLLPKWMVGLGLTLALVGELSWLSMMIPKAGILIPLARWPGFIWLIAVGFALPKYAGRLRSAA
jgi:hypothetical protein